MNIAFDLDGVLYPWHEALYNYLNLTKRSWTPTCWEFYREIDKYVSEDEVEYIRTIPTLYSCFLPSNEMLNMLKILNEAGHTIYYITSRPNDSVKTTTQIYIDKYKFPQSQNLIFSMDKTHEIRILEIDVIVEDRPENLEKFSSLCRTIGISQPWNDRKRDYLESLGVVFIPNVINLPEIL